MVMEFEIDGQKFTALNGGPIFKFTPAISFFVNCTSQEEVDYYWEMLSEGGEKSQCGWLVDKYGISWQIVPTILGQLMSDPDAEKAGRVTRAMLKMTKLDIAVLQQAYDGDEVDFRSAYLLAGSKSRHWIGFEMGAEKGRPMTIDEYIAQFPEDTSRSWSR